MLVRNTHIYYINACARCLSSVMFAVCQRSSFMPSFAESECKGTDFLDTDQTFGELFSRKMRKKEGLDKTVAQNGEIGTIKGLKS